MALVGKKILYIEDEPYLARIVIDTLKLKGYNVNHRRDGNKIGDLVGEFAPDLCILDVMLPDIDGYTLAKHIHNIDGRMPIIFLTAKTQTDDILKGFSSGGTDYLKKPFSMEELLVRIETQLKMSGRDTEAAQSLPDEIVLNKYKFYPVRYELQTPTESIKLTNREAQIICLLCTHLNKPLDRRILLQEVWGDDSFFNSRNLDVYMRKIRNYFAADSGIEIITLKGKGYQFVVS